jgi:1,2-phenylacetyl-CoA epoxidase catalytic subunit
MDDLIRRQDAIEELSYLQTYLFDSRDHDKKVSLEDVRYAIEQLPSAQSKQLKVLADVLDGCPLTQPCDKMWKSEGWCKEHCKPGQQEPNAECWLKYAEVMANAIENNNNLSSGNKCRTNDRTRT